MKPKNDMPPILEIYGTLEEIDLDPDGNTGYILISYSKRNKLALYKTIQELKEWRGRDTYIQLRQMTKSQDLPETTKP